jgi:hypothetical protein
VSGSDANANSIAPLQTRSRFLRARASQKASLSRQRPCQSTSGTEALPRFSNIQIRLIHSTAAAMTARPRLILPPTRLLQTRLHQHRQSNAAHCAACHSQWSADSPRLTVVRSLRLEVALSSYGCCCCCCVCAVAVGRQIMSSSMAELSRAELLEMLMKQQAELAKLRSSSSSRESSEGGGGEGSEVDEEDEAKRPEKPEEPHRHHRRHDQSPQAADDSEEDDEEEEPNERGPATATARTTVHVHHPQAPVTFNTNHYHLNRNGQTPKRKRGTAIQEHALLKRAVRDRLTETYFKLFVDTSSPLITVPPQATELLGAERLLMTSNWKQQQPVFSQHF